MHHLHNLQRVSDPPILWRPLVLGISLIQILSYLSPPMPFFALFFYICVNLVNDILFAIMDLDLLSLSTSVPETHHCLIYALRCQVH